MSNRSLPKSGYLIRCWFLNSCANIKKENEESWFMCSLILFFCYIYLFVLYKFCMWGGRAQAWAESLPSGGIVYLNLKLFLLF